MTYKTFIFITCTVIIAQTFQMSAQDVHSVIVANDNDTINAVYETIDVAPEYKGGQQALNQVLSDNIHYPAECAEAKIQGKVVVQFTIEKDGTVGDAKVVQSVHPLLDAEAVRVVKLLNDWTPGMKNGEPVRTSHTLPIVFRLMTDAEDVSNMPLDFSTWTFFDLRDSLIDFLTDLYKDVPREGYTMTNAQVLNDYIGVKCVLEYPTLPEKIKESLESGDEYGAALIISQAIAPQFPFEYRRQLCDHNIKLTYIIRDLSSDKEYTVVIDKDTWLPETWQTQKVTEIQIVEDTEQE